MLKFTITNGSLTITNTDNNVIILNVPKLVVVADALSLHQDNPVVFLYNSSIGIAQPLFVNLLSNCVDSTDTPFTVDSFLTFCKDNLGFNSGGASPQITVVTDYTDLPSPGTVTGQFYWVQTELDGYLTGLYYSNGSIWETSQAVDITVVANFNALPDPTTVTGQFYWCSASQGSNWNPFTGPFRNSGMYYSNGVSWENLSVPYQATQAEVDAGSNTDKFVTPSTLKNSTQFQFVDFTSSGQTQLNSKMQYFYRDSVASPPVTATTSNTIIASAEIPANTFQVGSSFDVLSMMQRVGTTGSATWRIYTNTINSLSGAVLLATYTNGAANLWFFPKRTFLVRSSNLLFGFANNVTLLNDELISNNAPTTSAFNPSVLNYIIIAIQPNSGGDSFTNELLEIKGQK